MKSGIRMIRSIRVRFSMMIVCVLILVISSLIFVNSNYLESYTIRTKINAITQTSDMIDRYVRSGYSEEALLNLEKKLRGSNLDTVVLSNLSTLPQVVFASDIRDGGSGDHLLRYFYGDTPQATEIYRNDEKRLIYRSYNERLNSYQVDCIGVLPGDVGYVISTPLESIRETVKLTNRLLVILGVFAALIGGLLMYLVTRGLTKPIGELADLSEQMAELDFDARYEGRQGDEIGLLGESMNRMSERLEKAVTDLRLANVQLERDLEERDRIDEKRRQFLSDVSHELKTPIALIQGYAEGLRDGIAEDTESRQYYCDVIADEASKMSVLVRRLMNLDELENGSNPMMAEELNISELVRSVAEAARVLIPENSGVELIIDTSQSISVMADPMMMEQAVQNYMSNAIHYVSQPGKVVVKTLRTEREAIVSVFNTGEAIPSHDLDQIWEKFYKVDKARTRAYGGSGIGLSIVKAIINSHLGRYGVRNCSDGVEFWFSLPLDKRTENIEAVTPNPGMEFGDGGEIA